MAAAVQPGTPSEWGDMNTVCGLIRVGRATGERMLAAARMPAPTRLGKLRRWNLDEIRRWMAAGAPDRATWEASGR